MRYSVKRIAYSVICLLVLVGIIVFRTRINNYLTSQSLKLLSRALNIQISAQKIKGSIFTSIVLSDVKIKFSSGDSLSAQSIKSEYNLFSIIFRHKNLIRNLLIVKPNVYLVSHLKKDDRSGLDSTNKEKSVSDESRSISYTLPMFLFNKLEIQNGTVFQNGKIILDSFSILTNLRLQPNSASASVNRAHLYLPKIPIKIQNFTGNISFHNNTLSLHNVSINTPSSRIQFNAIADFLNRYLSLDIKAGYYDLTEIANLKGNFDINGQIGIYFDKDKWNLLKIQSSLNYQSLNLKLPYVEISDGQGKIEFADSVANISCITPDSLIVNAQCFFTLPRQNEIYRPLTETVFNQINKNLYRISYQGKVSFNNFNISIKPPDTKNQQNKSDRIKSTDNKNRQNNSDLIKPTDTKNQQNKLDLISRLDGIIKFNGTGFEQIEFNLSASSQKPVIESISAKGTIVKGRLMIERLRIKDRTSILNSELKTLDSKVRMQKWIFEFKDFSLYLISEVLHQIGIDNFNIKGFVNGLCHLELIEQKIKTDGELNVRKGFLTLKKDNLSDIVYSIVDNEQDATYKEQERLFHYSHQPAASNILTSDLQNLPNQIYFKFEKLKLRYSVSDLQNLPEQINLCIESIVWSENRLSRFDFMLAKEKFLLSARNWTNSKVSSIESLDINGAIQNTNWSKIKFNFRQINIDNLIEHLKITTQNYSLVNTKEFSIGKKDKSFYIQDFTIKLGTGNLSLDLITYPQQKPQINFRAQQIDLQDIGNLIAKKTSTQGIVDLQFTSLSRSENNISANHLGYYISLSGKELKIPFDLFASDTDFYLIKKRPLRSSETDLKRTTQNAKFIDKGISAIEIKYLNGTAIWEDTNFQIKELKFVYDQDTSLISGKINLALNNSTEHQIDLNILLNDPGAWVFFFLKDVLIVQQAKISGQGKITGTVNRPIFSGIVNVSDARLLINTTQTLCHKVNAQLVFDKQKIFLNNLKGYAGNGIVQASGFTELHNFTQLETLSCEIEFQDAPMRPHKDIMGIASGKLSINYKPAEVNQKSAPLSLAGVIDIKEGLLTTEFAEPTAIGGEGKLNVDLNLTIFSERGLWLRNRLCDIELSANLNIFSQTSNNELTKPTSSSIVYSGQLKANLGIFYYLDHPLRITKGVIDFDNISELNPLLDISAEVYTRPIVIPSGLKERVKIILALTGRFKEPVFTFASEPSVLSEDDIISYLNFNVTWQEMTSQELKDAFSTALSEKLFGYFERQLTKRIRNLILLDYLWIESGLLSGTGAKVTVGKYIGSRLYFTYEYNISGTSHDIFRLEYYIAKSHQIIAERDADNHYNLKYQYKIRY
ncbi:MAG: translocation/assembly module TamB domain-containing protein [candidate division WOR-3 bacterium]